MLHHPSLTQQHRYLFLHAIMTMATQATGSKEQSDGRLARASVAHAAALLQNPKVATLLVGLLC